MQDKYCQVELAQGLHQPACSSAPNRYCTAPLNPSGKLVNVAYFFHLTPPRSDGRLAMAGAASAFAERRVGVCSFCVSASAEGASRPSAPHPRPGSAAHPRRSWQKGRDTKPERVIAPRSGKVSITTPSGAPYGGPAFARRVVRAHRLLNPAGTEAHDVNGRRFSVCILRSFVVLHLYTFLTSLLATSILL